MGCIFWVRLLFTSCIVVPLPARLASSIDHTTPLPNETSWRASAPNRQQHRLSKENLLETCADKAAKKLEQQLDHSYSPSFPWALLACSRPKKVEVAVLDDGGCLPQWETYDEDLESFHFNIDKAASVELIVQRVLDDTCASYRRPGGSHEAVWPEQCAVEHSFLFRGKMKQHNLKASCDNSSEFAVKTVDGVTSQLQDGQDFPFTMFASATPCYEKLSSTLALPEEQRRRDLHALASRTVDVLCWRNVAEGAMQAGCMAPASRAVETCGNAILKYLKGHRLLKQFCTKTNKDFATGPLSNVAGVQDAIVAYIKRGSDSDLTKNGVPKVCGGTLPDLPGRLKDMDLLLTSVAAAFKCACPDLHERLPAAAASVAGVLRH